MLIVINNAQITHIIDSTTKLICSKCGAIRNAIAVAVIAGIVYGIWVLMCSISGEPELVDDIIDVSDIGEI